MSGGGAQLKSILGADGSMVACSHFASVPYRNLRSSMKCISHNTYPTIVPAVNTSVYFRNAEGGGFRFVPDESVGFFYSLLSFQETRKDCILVLYAKPKRGVAALTCCRSTTSIASRSSTCG